MVIMEAREQDTIRAYKAYKPISNQGDRSNKGACIDLVEDDQDDGEGKWGYKNLDGMRWNW